MTNELSKIGLYWQPLGGNNIDQISGHCYRYTDISKNGSTTIVVDLGKFDNHQALGIKNSAAAVPDIRAFLPFAEALFLTHSHPDHINGIMHYIKAGFKLPKLYAGKYTFMILSDLLKNFGVDDSFWPEFITINDGDVIKIGSMEIEAVSSSHTCFDSFGFVIKTPNSTIYHTGDMKIDASTYFRKPTNIKRLKELKTEIKAVVADFCGVYDDGFATREVDTFKRMVSIIKKSQKDKIFIPVYPTHPEMYIIAFLAALKLKKNVIFYGNKDFYTYLNMIIGYGIDFKKLAKERIRVIYAETESFLDTTDNYAVIGTYNNLSSQFDYSAKDSFGIITAKTFFNPLKGLFNLRNVRFAGIEDAPELQGFGHGFLQDYEFLNSILENPVFIPTHCPVFVIDNFRALSEFVGIKLLKTTPKNNEIYRINGKDCELVQGIPAKWLAVTYNEGLAHMSEVFQKPSSGIGFLKRTLSNRRCKSRFKSFLYKRKKDNKNGSIETA